MHNEEKKKNTVHKMINLIEIVEIIWFLMKLWPSYIYEWFRNDQKQ